LKCSNDFFCIANIVAQSLKKQLSEATPPGQPKPPGLPCCPLHEFRDPFMAHKTRAFFHPSTLKTLNHPESHFQQFHQLPPPLNFSINHLKICSENGHLVSFQSFFFFLALFISVIISSNIRANRAILNQIIEGLINFLNKSD